MAAVDDDNDTEVELTLGVDCASSAFEAIDGESDNDDADSGANTAAESAVVVVTHCRFAGTKSGSSLDRSWITPDVAD